MKSFFVFDVESIGLHGEGFAVAGGVYLENGATQWEFSFACPLEECAGDDEDRAWVKANVPLLEITHRNPHTMREALWAVWMRAKNMGAVMAAECAWPVEAGFLSACVKQDSAARKFAGPYPLVEISTYLAAAGFDPMATYGRTESEKPQHNPLCDARQSARLLAMAIEEIQSTTVVKS